VLAHNKTLAAQLYGEFKDSFPTTRSSTSFPITTTTSGGLRPFLDTYIEKDASIQRAHRADAAVATKALLERPDSIIVATVSAIYGLGDPEAYLQMVLHLVKGDRMDQRQLLRRLADMQYTRNEMDLSQGTFRVRGTSWTSPGGIGARAVRRPVLHEEIESLGLRPAHGRGAETGSPG